MDWSAYLACEVCKALAGAACMLRTGGGPQALPDIVAERPHTSRPRCAAARKAAGETSPAKPARTKGQAQYAAALAAARKGRGARPGDPGRARPRPERAGPPEPTSTG